MNKPSPCSQCQGRGVSYLGHNGVDHMNAHLCTHCTGSGKEPTKREKMLRVLDNYVSRRQPPISARDLAKRCKVSYRYAKIVRAEWLAERRGGA